MQMMMEAHRMSRTQTTLDLNVVTVVPTTLLSGEGAKLGSSFVTHAVCTLAFGESLDLSRSRETKFDRDLNTFPSDIISLIIWVAAILLLFNPLTTHRWTLNETNNNIKWGTLSINLDTSFLFIHRIYVYVYVFFWGP
jgi:hypothetical protein